MKPIFEFAWREIIFIPPMKRILPKPELRNHLHPADESEFPNAGNEKPSSEHE
ncbi:hypothetical protein J2S19_003356 [Metabacillus malikii]|uniref:Uncharacterized protein n=1 Tax=Metabacillus malikii TaxID=1504265 RepID=A0ABT9ZJV8_9BACI|nr:hypothetical protein [Metabacillus malikii]